MNQIFQNLIGGRPQVVQRPQEAQQRSPTFFQELRVYPSFFCQREDIDKGDKILLPASALNQLYHLISGRNKSPMIFCLQNPLMGKLTYCGVLEFVAEEGNCYIPKWMFKMLKFPEPGSHGSVCLVSDLKRNKGTNFVKLQPHQTKFIQLPNPKAVLQIQLRNFTCLHVGDTIRIQTFDGEYDIDILQIKPKNQYDALCVIDADVEVDFAPPLDYEQPTLAHKKHSHVTFQGGQTQNVQPGKNAFFTGQGVRIDQKSQNAYKVINLETLESHLNRYKLQNNMILESIEQLVECVNLRMTLKEHQQRSGERLQDFVNDEYIECSKDLQFLDQDQILQNHRQQHLRIVYKIIKQMFQKFLFKKGLPVKCKNSIQSSLSTQLLLSLGQRICKNNKLIDTKRRVINQYQDYLYEFIKLKKEQDGYLVQYLVRSTLLIYCIWNYKHLTLCTLYIILYRS